MAYILLLLTPCYKDKAKHINKYLEMKIQYRWKYNMAYTLLEPDEMQIDGRLTARAQFLCLVLL